MTEFKSGDVIWAKFGKLFWPATVLSRDELPEDVKEDLESETKQPKVIAKFFDEEGYEFVYDTKNVHPYNGPRKEDFIKKGVAKVRTLVKQGAKKDDGWFSKFPKDVIKSEELTGGDPRILEKDPFVEKVEQKIDYKEIFGPTEDAKKKGKKGSKSEVDSPSPTKGGRKRGSATPPTASPSKRGRRGSSPQRPIVHPRFRAGGGGSDHQVKIMHQPSTPYHLDLQKKEEAKQKGVSNSPAGAGGSAGTPGQGGGAYTCHYCGFTATRLNVIMMCQKTCAAKSKLSGSAGKSSSLVSPARNVSSLVSPARSKAASPVSRRKTETGLAAAAKAAADAKSKHATPKAPTKTTTKATPKKIAATPKPATPITTQENTPVSPDKVEPAAAKTESGQSAKKPAEKMVPPKTKKQRMTKKQKIEQEKKKEERKNILDEWGDEEEDESAEKKKINETLGRSSDDAGGDSDDESVKGEGVFGDDNVHGYDDDEEEAIYPEKKGKSSDSTADQTDKSVVNKTDKSVGGDKSDKSVNGKGDKSFDDKNEEKVDEKTDEKVDEKTDTKVDDKNSDSSEENQTSTTKESEKEELKEAENVEEEKKDGKQKAEEVAKVDQLLSEDIGKLLEETKVPELPPVVIAKPDPGLAAATPAVVAAKKSIKFSETLTKELQQKKMQLVQAESNLDIPDEVDDEFAESNVDINDVPAAVKPILKHAKSDSRTDTEAKEDVPSQVQRDELDKAAEEKSKEETVVSSLLALQAGQPVPQAAVTQAVVTHEVPMYAASMQHAAHASEMSHQAVVTQGVAAVTAASTVASHSHSQEETYILLVDENSAVDSSQVLYLDPNSLANGNVLLMPSNDDNPANGTATAQHDVTAPVSAVTAVPAVSCNGMQQLQVVKDQSQQISLIQQHQHQPGGAAQQLQQAQVTQSAVVAPPTTNNQ